MFHRSMILGTFLGALVGPGAASAQEGRNPAVFKGEIVGIEPSFRCPSDSATVVEGGAALPRRLTTRDADDLRSRLSAMANALVQKLAERERPAVPEEHIAISSTGDCVVASFRFIPALTEETSIPQEISGEISSISSGLSQSIDHAMHQVSSGTVPIEGDDDLCYYSPTLGILICLDLDWLRF